MNERLSEQLVKKLSSLVMEKKAIQSVLGNQYWHYDKMVVFAIRDIERKLNGDLKKMSKEQIGKQVGYKGVCCFHSETGTEGGYWAFQDERFIDRFDDNKLCAKCGLYREFLENWHNRRLKHPKSLIEYWDGIIEKACKPEKHSWQPAFPNGKWSYEGLHILKDGDRLTVYSPKKLDEIVWSGDVSLKKFPVFSQDAFGLWIHADQVGVDRETWAKWFFEEYPAELITKAK